ncbi:nitrilase [Paenibacillus oralis]|uniref:Nitrilase n=1 Tax=Paenibacillus oralis TaxID=2490856 RepID=A0A3P3UC72_9BACL|nr:nitrilase-related carbon-nitrogen hydrolase [Paenibacillus oralis]RRJ67276.1 nitrilase [Paenibacillus oralis]
MTSKDSSREWIAAAVQFHPVHGVPERNRQAMAALLREAAAHGAKLIVFPEMASSGYVWESREEISPFVEPIPGPTTNALLEMTSRYDCYAVVGLPELDLKTGAYYNSAVLIGPHGVIGVYRKTHLFAADPRWAREGGEGVQVYHTPLGKIAMLICMDAMYFEPSRLAALQEADIVAFPTNWVGGGNNPPSNTWRLRAWENGVNWIAANRSDLERGAQFTGGSGIISPNGEVQQSKVSGEGIVYGVVKASGERRRRQLKGRRPQAYQELLLHPYLWQEGETRRISVQQPFDVILVPHRSEDGETVEAVDASLRRVEALQRQSERRIIVLPELRLDPMQEGKASMLTGLGHLAEEYGSYLVAALVESGVADLKRSIYLVGPEGQIGLAHVVHSDAVQLDALGGQTAFRTFELPFARVGILTGEDAGYPESFRILAKQGADIIAVSSNGSERGEVWMRRIWAFENDAVLAMAAPPESDQSLLFLHRQVHLEGRMEGEAFGHRFSLEEIRIARGRPFMRRLKTHLYDQLVQSDRKE